MVVLQSARQIKWRDSRRAGGGAPRQLPGHSDTTHKKLTSVGINYEKFIAKTCPSSGVEPRDTGVRNGCSPPAHGGRRTRAFYDGGQRRERGQRPVRRGRIGLRYSVPFCCSKMILIMRAVSGDASHRGPRAQPAY
ncbi:hypothetical protein EVAR_65841_1 [Eumeta japonica]|uniref:Uncharacterized protein n=1 Tax=Eumeta variegata TaxID=151549 RepID=A0A4C1ZM63_EUMVA|nr:hypothetical protein EVAR_65841_1 [Eumeta japonica]